MTPTKFPIAEIIAVGDEMTSGQRLDTNSQWLAQQVNDLGIEVAFHSTVGDDLKRQTEVIRTAAERANIVVMTGGLGPTKDDLTRQAIADAAGVELEVDEAALRHIESIFARHKRVMSPANRQQANFPRGGKTIHNEEGTAPGVDFPTESSRVFAMPGVPYEMKMMWETYVAAEIVAMSGAKKIIRHHVLRCFGIGESEAESRMPDLIARDREPRVGITASMAVISFRITATADSEEECQKQIQSTVAYIRETLGEVVFGENEDQLNQVTANLLDERGLSVSFIDFQFGGAAATKLRNGTINGNEHVFQGSLVNDGQTPEQWLDAGEVCADSAIEKSALRIMRLNGSKIGIAIGKLDQDTEDQPFGSFNVAVVTAEGNQSFKKTFRYVGHSSMRQERSANQVVNFLRLTLLSLSQSGT
jgi:nicotinamide-nucleotide amidase